MFGRAQELSELDAARARARDGTPGVVLVVGEAGIGKTRLLQQAAEHARSDGARVLVGASAPYAYGPLIGILRELRRQMGDPRLQRMLTGVRRPLARLVPGLEPGNVSGSGEVTAQAPLFEAVLDLVAELGRDTAVLMGMEDLHQADRSTLDLVGFLVANLSTEHAVLVATCRTDGVRSERVGNFLAEVVRHPTVQRLDLSPLSDGEVTRLLTAIRQGRPPEETAVRIAKRSQGNPFYVEELLAAGDGDPDLPHGLEDLLMARLAGMSESTREVLRVAAVLGDRPHDRLLRGICDLEDAELRSGLQQAADQGLLVPESDTSERYRFRHDLIREVVHRRLLVDQRQRLHAAAARGLEADPDLAAGGPGQVNAELARHWHLAGEPNEAFVASVTAASEAKQIHALSEALAHLQRALALWEQINGSLRDEVGPRHALELRCAELALLLADPATGLEHIDRALSSPDVPPATRSLLHARATDFLRALGRPDEAEARIARALELVPQDASRERAAVLAHAASHHVLTGRTSEGLTYSLEAIDVAVEVGDPISEAMARNYHGTALHVQGEEDAGLEQLRQALALARRCDNAEEIKHAYINLSVMLARSGRFAEAVEVADAGRQWAFEHGIGASHTEWLAFTTATALRQDGRWTEADAVLASVRSVSRSSTLTDVVGAISVAGLRVGQGRFDVVRQELDRITSNPVYRSQPQLESDYLSLTVELARAEGRHADAFDAAERAQRRAAAIVDEEGRVTYDAARYLDPALVHGIGAEIDLALHARADGDDGSVDAARDRARRLLGTLRSALDEPPGGTHVHARLVASVTLGEAELTRLDDASDPPAWRTAVAAAEGTGIPFRVAYTRFRLAEALLAHGDRDAASAALEQADDVAGELGAEPLRQQIASLARRGRLGRHAARRDENLGSDLTPRETDVVELLVEGRTNRQIAEALYVTEKTVERHVTSILSKLQVDNRTAAAAVVRRRELLDTPPRP